MQHTIQTISRWNHPDGQRCILLTNLFHVWLQIILGIFHFPLNFSLASLGRVVKTWHPLKESSWCHVMFKLELKGTNFLPVFIIISWLKVLCLVNHLGHMNETSLSFSKNISIYMPQQHIVTYMCMFVDHCHFYDFYYFVVWLQNSGVSLKFSATCFWAPKVLKNVCSRLCCLVFFYMCTEMSGGFIETTRQFHCKSAPLLMQFVLSCRWQMW